jgi:hypothetical protein
LCRDSNQQQGCSEKNLGEHLIARKKSKGIQTLRYKMNDAEKREIPEMYEKDDKQGRLQAEREPKEKWCQLLIPLRMLDERTGGIGSGGGTLRMETSKGGKRKLARGEEEDQEIAEDIVVVEGAVESRRESSGKIGTKRKEVELEEEERSVILSIHNALEADTLNNKSITAIHDKKIDRGQTDRYQNNDDVSQSHTVARKNTQSHDCKPERKAEERKRSQRNRYLYNEGAFSLQVVGGRYSAATAARNHHCQT